MNSDGRMDIHEFSIAMKLIKLMLQGHPLPPSLPPNMKQPPLPLPPQSGFGKGQNTPNTACNSVLLKLLFIHHNGVCFSQLAPGKCLFTLNVFLPRQVCPPWPPWRLLWQVCLPFLFRPSLLECRRRSSPLAHPPSPRLSPTGLHPLAWCSQSQASPTLVINKRVMKRGKCLCLGKMSVSQFSVCILNFLVFTL